MLHRHSQATNIRITVLAEELTSTVRHSLLVRVLPHVADVRGGADLEMDGRLGWGPS